MFFRFMIVIAVLGAGVLISGCYDKEVSEVPGATGSSLFAGVDTYGKLITTDSAEAQKWFDQGLVLLYAFNHDEATRSFREAAAHDPTAAMPWFCVRRGRWRCRSVRT